MIIQGLDVHEIYLFIAFENLKFVENNSFHHQSSLTMIYNEYRCCKIYQYNVSSVLCSFRNMAEALKWEG